MGILRHFKRLQYIDYIIRKRATGNLDTFAQKNGLSKRGLAIVLQEMKEMGFPIKYSRKIGTYFYEEKGELVKCLFMKYGELLAEDEMKNIKHSPDKLCFSTSNVFVACETK